jgi:putative N6-adenine-specific DNA methylase
MDLFVTCAQTLEPLLADELAQLGFHDIIKGYRGIHVKGVGMDAVYRINYLSRLGGRVLLPLTRFRCPDDKSLYSGIGKIDWRQYLPKGKSIAIDANVSHPRLRNSLFAAQVAKDAICDQLREKYGWRPDVNVKEPDVQLNLYVNNDTAVMSIDTSGKPLHKRGYRQESVEAPMQETLAAALLVLAGFQGHEILCDPCCGSGTLLIEAALIASKTPPGFLRSRWGFMHLPQFSNEEWLQVKIQADQARVPLPKHQFFGADINKQAVHACKVNARAVGFHQIVEVVQSDVRDYQPPAAPNFIITNPPYGKRMDDVQHLKSLYRALGDFMKRQSAKPAKGFVFTGSMELSKEVGLSAARRHVVDNGGIDSRLLEFDLY